MNFNSTYKVEKLHKHSLKIYKNDANHYRIDVKDKATSIDEIIQSFSLLIEPAALTTTTTIASAAVQKVPSEDKLVKHRKRSNSTSENSSATSCTTNSSGNGGNGEKSNRENILKEIYTSEKSYVDSLNELVLKCYRPIKDQKGLFSSQEVKLLFSNIEVVRNVNLELLSSIEKLYVGAGMLQTGGVWVGGEG